LRLRLPISSHGSIYQSATITQPRAGGIQGMKWFLSWMQRKQMVGLESEGCAPVLPDDTSISDDDSRTELMIGTLNEGDCQSRAIDYTHPDRVSRIGTRSPRERLRLIDLFGEFGQGLG